MSLHQRLVRLGIRWVPQYDMSCEVETPEVDCGDWLNEIRALKDRGTPLALEQILTRSRLPVIRQHIEPKTLLYTHYIQGIDRVLREGLVADGWKVGFYTGEDKSGLDAFINGDLDVLIGSSAIGTGVDGLQRVCAKLIINVLPWTHAECEQLKGRIYRQGQRREKVRVERRRRRYGDFSTINRTWNRSRSDTTHARLQENAEEWAHYHTVYREARRDWTAVPYEEVIKWCRHRSGYVIGDFGCGEAKLAEALSDRHTVYSFDHVAITNDVVACDIAHVPLDDETLDVAVFSLSLMGSTPTICAKRTAH